MAHVDNKGLIFGLSPVVMIELDIRDSWNIFDGNDWASQRRVTGRTYAGLFTLSAIDLLTPVAAKGMIGAVGLAADGAGGQVGGAQPAVAIGANSRAVSADQLVTHGATLETARPALIPVAAGARIEARGVDSVSPVTQSQVVNRFLAVGTIE